MKPVAQEIELREGKPFIIYALVCPLSLEVKYVGQTIDIEQRVRGTVHSLTKQDTPLRRWQNGLGYLKPYRVILERGNNRRIEVKTTTPDSQRGRRPIGLRTIWLSSALETKWIKRFRRTIL